MTTPVPNRQRQLDKLITEIAGHLMGVPGSKAGEAMEGALENLLEFFSVDQTFLRRNRHEAGSSLLMAEWPKRDVVPIPDPLHEVAFSADPIFGMCAELKRPFIAYPEDSPDYQDRVKAGSGEAETTMAMVPLLREDVTVGVLGLIRFNNLRWEEEEVATLGAIASLIAQMWGRHDAEAKIAYQAHYDDLTDLANRRLLEEKIEALDPSSPISLMVIDIDNMKAINDGLNYETGNQFLVEMSQRLVETVRKTTCVARLVGDQFGLLVVDSEPSNVETLADRLVETLSSPFDINGVAIIRTVSIGLAHNSGADASSVPHETRDLLQEAGVAMFDAKQGGKNRVAVFNEEIYQKVSRQYKVETELRQAITAGDQLCLHYQPEVDLRTGLVVAVEALMRWQHPERGMLAAGEFVKVAEESGLIVEIGDFVLREAISQLARWKTDNPEMVMRVNVSPAQLISRGLAAQIRALVKEFDIDARYLCIEVTEHVMIADHEFTMDILNEIRAMGVKIALDDFGTGYSSMEQLKRLPIDALKIDRVFMIELATNKRDAAIVDATILLANALELDTVAEGIEEEEQVLELLKRGCYRAQGFLLARPAPPEVTEKLFGIRLKAGRLKLWEVEAANLVGGK